MLNDFERRKYDVIKEVVDGKIDKVTAMKKLGYSIQHIHRLLKLYEQEGEPGFIHKGKARPSAQAFSKEVRTRIIELYQDKYANQTFVNFTRCLNEEEGIKISRTSVGTILKSVGIFPPSKGKK